MKDSKQGELIEEESRWVESKILPPDAPLFILKGEVQISRAVWSKKKTALHLTVPLQSRFAPSKRMGRWCSPKSADEVEVDAG